MESKKLCMGCMQEYDETLDVCPYCGYMDGQETPHALHMKPGSTIKKRYIIGRALGYGGFGVTYLGWDKLMRRKVAVKEYLPSDCATRVSYDSKLILTEEERFARGKNKFRQEAEKLGKLGKVEGVVYVYDTFEENNTVYIVMEYLEGETLTSLMSKKGTFTQEETMDLMFPILEALDKVHEAGIIHRDISPDNIFIATDSAGHQNVKLIDFGAARFASSSHSKSLTMTLRPGYSPEELYRTSGEYGPHSDVYSVAAVMYQMVTGVRPIDALERRTLIERKKKDPMIKTFQSNDKVSENFETALLNALNVKIEDRTPTTGELANELVSYEKVKRRGSSIKRIDFMKWPLWAKIGAPIAAMAAIGVFVGVSIWLAGLNVATEALSLPEGYTYVTSLIGKNYDEASKIAEDHTLLITQQAQRYSARYDAGIVIKQDTAPFTVLINNSVIGVEVSTGVERYTLPDMVGFDEGYAAAALECMNLEVELVRVQNSVLAEGCVIEQSVDPYSEVQNGETVQLLISAGPGTTEKKKALNLAGMSLQEAMIAAEEAGVTLRVSEKTFVPGTKGNQVISQNIQPGDEIDAGEALDITVAMEPRSFIMPNLVYKNEEQAVQLMKNCGSRAKIVKVNDEMLAEGLVVEQEVVQDSEYSVTIEPGSEVELKVSKGPHPVAMIDVTNKSEQEAKKLISDLLLVVKVSYEPSLEVEEGHVISQSVIGGQEVARGTEVSLVVCSNEGLVLLEDMTGKTKKEAQDWLKNAELKTTIVEKFDEEIEKGLVISQLPESGTLQKLGTEVVLTISKGKEEIPIPSVVGMKLKEANELLREKGFTTKIEYQFDSSERNSVISQNPDKNAKAVRGTVIALIISKGPEQIQVPEVIGKAYKEAEKQLKDAGFEVEKKENFSSEPKDQVISQEPYGKKADKGSKVTVTVSKGLRQVTVPNVVNKSNTDAVEALKKAGFKVETIFENNDTVPKDQVISQNPDGGKQVDEGSVVILVVSGGKEMHKIPNIVGRTFEIAKITLEAAGFIVEKSEDFSDKPAGIVISQDPLDGKAPKQTTIRIIVSKGVEQVSVPDVVNLTVSQARSALEKKGFTVEVKYEHSSKTEGTVIKQNPVNGSVIPKGSVVTITVSSGLEMITVPDVIGKAASQAENSLKALGFYVKTNYEYSSKAEGTVISQDPVEGSQIAKGAVVTITVSRGLEMIAVPDVIGKTASQAESSLKAQGFSVSINYEYSSKAQNTVIRQSPSGGSSVAKGSVITITVSSGTEMIAVPDVIGKTASQAESSLKTQGFSVSINYEYSNKPQNTVIRQNPSGGSSAAKGSVVTLTVSSGMEMIAVPDVIGKTVSQAESTLKAQGFSVEFNYEYSSKAQNTVIRQNPSGGSNAAKGSKITLTISSGIQQVAVPKVIGKSSSQAQRDIEAAGLICSVNYVYSNETKDTVINQSPEGGRQVSKGTTVVITISNGPEPVWSDWVSELPGDVSSSNYYIEEKTQYAYRDRETTTSSSPSLEGWTQYGTPISYWSEYGSYSDWTENMITANDQTSVQSKNQYRTKEYTIDYFSNRPSSPWEVMETTSKLGAWSDWTTTPMTATDYLKVETKTQYRYMDGTWVTQYGTPGAWQDGVLYESSSQKVETKSVEYRVMYHYCTGANSNPAYQTAQNYINGFTYHEYGIYQNDYTLINHPGGWGYLCPGSSSCTINGQTIKNIYRCPNTCYSFFMSDAKYKTMYRAVPVSSVLSFSNSSWSSWSDNRYSASDTRKVETRTMYRSQAISYTYKARKLNDWGSWVDGDAPSVGGSIGAVDTRALYRYKTRELLYTYYFERWGELSGWTDNAVIANENRRVKTRTLYRYKRKQ